MAGLEIIDEGRSPGEGLGAKPPEADDIILKITIANIVSCDHCIKLEVAILAEWIKIVSTVSVFSFFTLVHATPTDDGGAHKPASVFIYQATYASISMLCLPTCYRYTTR